MPNVSEIISDTEVIKIRGDFGFHHFYTCFPADKEDNKYECTLGFFDSYYTKKDYHENEWKIMKVSSFIPVYFHERYLKIKNHTIDLTLK